MSKKKRAKERREAESPPSRGIRIGMKKRSRQGRTPSGRLNLLSAGIRSWIRNSWANPAYRFVLLFVIYLGIIAVAYPLLTNNLYFMVEGMMVGTAQVEGFILSIFSSDTVAAGKLVSFKGFPVKIIEECTGIYEILIFMAAVMAFPTSIRKKAIGLAFGVPLMYLFNVARILVLIVIGAYYYSVFDFMHLYFWQVTLILMITSVWVLWILKVVKREEKTLASDS